MTWQGNGSAKGAHGQALGERKTLVPLYHFVLFCGWKPGQAPSSAAQ